MSDFLSSGHTMCAGCGVAIAVHQVSKSSPKNVIISCATSCLEVTTSAYPTTAWNVPWIHAAFETSASVASGVEAAVKRLGKDWKVIAMAGDGGTFDIGIQALSGMLERGHKVTQICLDNEAYMNCLALSTDVMTKEGLRNITNVKKGDMIYAFNQKTHSIVLKKCTGVFDNGRKKVFELSTLHHNIKATGNHPFLTVERAGRGRKNSLAWKTLEELRKGDQIIVLKNLSSERSFSFRPIKATRKGDYKVNRLNDARIPTHSSPDLLEFLGIFAGDGWTRKARGEIGFALPEGKYGRNRLLMLQERLFGMKPRFTKNYIYLNSVNISRFIDSLGFNHPAKKKAVPGWVFTLPADEKEAFVRGLMLSDGYKTGNSSRIVSASFDLLKTTRLLLQTMGYRVGKIHEQIKKKGTHCVYRKLLKDSRYGYICFSERSDWNTEKYPSQYRYQNFLIGNDHFETEKIMGIKPVGTEPTLDLRVEGEHNFIADGIVVHNTGIQRSGGTPHAAWTTTSPPGKTTQGKEEWKKPLADIIAAHRIPYVASASIAYFPDLKAKVKKALEKQPSFLHIYSPCPTGWKSDVSQSVAIAKLAVDTGAWPLYEIEDGAFRLTKKASKRKPIQEYLKTQGRFKHLTPETLKDVQKHNDLLWKELEAREKAGLKHLY